MSLPPAPSLIASPGFNTRVFVFYSTCWLFPPEQADFFF